MAKHWALQEAKARLSELVRAAEKEPQHITVRGEPAAVLISEKEYKLRFGRRGKEPKTLLEVLLACQRVPEFELPPRKRDPDRDIGL